MISKAGRQDLKVVTQKIELPKPYFIPHKISRSYSIFAIQLTRTTKFAEKNAR